MNSFTLRRLAVCIGSASLAVLIGCKGPPTSDDIQQAQQEKVLMEGTAQVGMPAIKNFRERKLAKAILELRDQNDYSTFTYLWSDYQGRWIFFCHSIGYAMPYATQFTNPQKVVKGGSSNSGYWGVAIPQADPNGLFSPASAEGTWVMCKDPKGTEVKPVYLEPRSIVSPFELSDPQTMLADASTKRDSKKKDAKKEEE